MVVGLRGVTPAAGAPVLPADNLPLVCVGPIVALVEADRVPHANGRYATLQLLSTRTLQVSYQRLWVCDNRCNNFMVCIT